MSNYKDLLTIALSENGWEKIEISDVGLEWWADEVWQIRSLKQHWGLEIFLTFLVDPQWDGPRKQGQSIWAILATKDFPKTWSQQPDKISELSMSKRKFNLKLDEFVKDLNKFRNSV